MRSDAELIIGSRDDPDLFRLFYDRHAERVHAYFVGRTRDRDVALDLTAETFAQAWISRGRFRDLAGGSASPWLFTIAKRVLLASVQRRRLETAALERLRVELPRHPTSSDWLEMCDELRAALDELPRRQRQAIAMRIIGGLSYRAIAERVGCSSTAARIRVSRGLRALRARMEANEA